MFTHKTAQRIKHYAVFLRNIFEIMKASTKNAAIPKSTPILSTKTSKVRHALSGTKY